MATTTLRQLNGFDETPATFEDAVLVLVDYQNTYTGGVMELDGWEPALASASRLLARAREAGAPSSTSGTADTASTPSRAPSMPRSHPWPARPSSPSPYRTASTAPISTRSSRPPAART